MNDRPALVISIKEARKLMGATSKHLTNDELQTMIAGFTELIRLELRRADVRKIEMVESQDES